MLLNVLYQTNDYYAVVTGVSMTSLLINNVDIETIRIYVLDDAISDDNREKMRCLCEEYGRSICFIDTEEIKRKLIELRVVPFRNTYTTYFKLIALQDLEIESGRILQIDGDTIINESLRDLLTVDLTDYICAASYDCVLNDYKKMIGIESYGKYYNCGVLLINHDLWLQEECTKKIINHLSNQRAGYFTVDQDIINVLFGSRIQLLPMKYNLNSGFYIYGVEGSIRIYGLKDKFYYTREEICEALSAPVINHCMGAMTGRPWEADSIHPQNSLFNKYLDKSPWRGFVKVKKERSLLFRIQRHLYLILPRRAYDVIHKLVLRVYLARMNANAIRASDQNKTRKKSGEK